MKNNNITNNLKNNEVVDNEYEVSLDSSSVVQLANDGNDIPQVKYNFVSIANINDIEKESVVGKFLIIFFSSFINFYRYFGYCCSNW